MNLRGVLFWGCLVTSLLTGSLVTAQESVGSGVEPELMGPPEDPTIGRARRHFEAGVGLTQRELWEAALAEFDESLRILHTSNALLNRAVCLEHLRRYQEAVEAFQEYLERYGEPLSDERRHEFERHVEELLGLLTPVYFDIQPAGALVVLGGRTLGQAPIEGPLLLPSGEHRLEVFADGYISHFNDFLVVLGRPVALEIELERELTHGFIRIVANVQGAEVTIDGHEAGPAPYEGHHRPGSHIIEVRANGYQTHSETINILEGDERLLSVELQNRRLPRSWFWSVFGVSLASLVATSSLGIAALVYDASYDPSDPADYNKYYRGHDIMLATDITLALTIGGIIATVVLALLTEWSRSENPTYVTPPTMGDEQRSPNLSSLSQPIM